ncbi:TPR domain-containing protein [Seiridium cupressi]
MGKTRPDKKNKKKGGISRAAESNSNSENAKSMSPLYLVSVAEELVQGGHPAHALTICKQALDASQPSSDGALASLNLLGQINLELGDFDSARSYFLRAVAMDQDGSRSEEVGGGPEKFLCLAQLSEEGGMDSVRWFEKGASTLKTQIQKLEEETQRRRTDEQEMALDELRRKNAMCLCGVAEIYMTDLSWEADAEQRCEALVTEATMTAPDSAESWQTLANVRISQTRIDDAKAALLRSMEIWRDLPTDDPNVPDFPSRVSLARLLMEVEMEQEALEVLERLVGEDDHSVEVWYLGGWALYVMGDKQKGEKTGEEDEWKMSWISSRTWLNQCLTLFKDQEYEDDRLGEHANELLAGIAKELGEPVPGEEDEDEEEGDWEDDDADEDDEMED